MTTLEQLKADIDLAIKGTSNTATIGVLGFIKRLAAETNQGAPSDGDALRAQNRKLIADLDHLNQLMNDQADILNKLRDILRINPEQPSTQLVPLATATMQQLDALRNENAAIKEANVALQDTVSRLTLKIQERTLGPGKRELPPG